jgi:tetratricopeptide (TPR) repeat protein
MLTYIIIFVFFIILAIIALYMVNLFVLPKKIEEIEKMIETGQTKMAIRKLTEMLEKDDRDSMAHYLMAEAYMKDGNAQYAIVEYRQVLKLGRFDEKIRESAVRSQLAYLYMAKKATEEAKKEFLILTKVDPANYENYYELGKIFFNANVMEKASGFFKKSVASNQKHSDSYFYLGQIYYRGGAYSDAKNYLINTVKLDPNNYKAHYYLGLVLRHQGDYEWALKELDIASKDDGLKVQCFKAKGACYMEKNQYPKAVMEFERGVKYAKRGSDAELSLRYFMADCQERMRDVPSAIANWERISEVNSKFKDVPDKLKQYNEFRQDDRIKDFMIAGLSQFELVSRRIVESMHFRIMDIEIINDTDIEIVATEVEGKWRNARQTNRIIRIIRTTDKIAESFLRRLHEKMKQKNATRIVVITTGDFESKATDFANTRPIELFGKSHLVELLKKI